jgi:hypothetical protein
MIIAPTALLRSIRQVHIDRSIRRSNKQLRLYVDTADVRQAIVGAHAYFDGLGTYLTGDFHSLRALVWSILWCGAAGAVRLLAPHQAELLTLLQYGFNRDEAVTDAERVSMLLANATAEPTSSADEQLMTMIKIAAAAPWPWQHRLATLVRKGALEVETIREDYTAVIKDELFHRLYDAFQHYRAGKENNNFADAAALATVVRAAEAFQRGESRELPRLYASSTLFEAALLHANVRERLAFSIDGMDFDALVDPSYVIVHSLFDEDMKSLEADFADSISEVFAALAEGPVEAGAHTLGLVNGFRDSLAVMTSALLYQRVWQPISDTVDEQASHALAPNSPLSVEQLTQIRDITARLRANTDEFRRLRDIWVAATEAFAAFSKRKLPARALHIEGLVRFSFPKRTLAEIERHISLLRSKDQVIIDNVSILTARVVKTPEPSRTDFFVVAALLWVLKLDDRLLRLLEGASQMHPSLRFLRAAAFLRSESSAAVAVAEQTAEDLDSLYRSAAKDAQRAALAIGIAYIEFRLALNDGLIPTWRRADDELGILGSNGRQHIERAVERARFAATCLDLDDDRRAYATNQYLYYLVADGAESPTLQSAASRLGTFKYNDSAWQYRFDDTIARYFALRARREQDRRAKLQLLRFAFDASEVAMAAVPDDGEVRAFSDQMRIAVGGDILQQRRDDMDVARAVPPTVT